MKTNNPSQFIVQEILLKWSNILWQKALYYIYFLGIS